MHAPSRVLLLRVLGLSVAVLAPLAACSSSESDVDPVADGGTNGDANGSLDGGGAEGSVATCSKDADCPSGVCSIARGACVDASCTDGAKNGAETDVDCGGSCTLCAADKACKTSADCASGVCAGEGTNLTCQAPTTTDGVKNGTETDIDCGGIGNPKCANDKVCTERADCTSDTCTGGKCVPVSPGDGQQNGAETDVDCGGPDAKRCADDKMCRVDGDCASDVCKQTAGQLRCQAATASDGKKNGTETDIDCGGESGTACAAGKACVENADCSSLGCNYAKKCAAGRSCTRHFGGDTCGLGGEGGVGPAQWEDCCVTANVTPTSGPTQGTAVKLGKYQVTAGRMRAFLEDVNYDVRGFVKQARQAGRVPKIPGQATRTVLEADWDLYLPTSFAGSTAAGELADCAQGDTTTALGTTCKPSTQQAGIYTAVSRHLGGFIFKGNNQPSTGCFVGSPGTHAFRFPDDAQDGPAPAHGQDIYDTKSMQCIDYLVAQAFCVWDGGRLEGLEEWQAAWGGAALPWGATRPPHAVTDNTYWGCRFPWSTDANQNDCGAPFDPAKETLEFANWKYSYEYPKQTSSDYIVFISAPGRLRGRGPGGHADVIGNNFELTSTVTYNKDPHVAEHRWSGNGSWEVHNYDKTPDRKSGLLNKYGKVGLRCAY